MTTDQETTRIVRSWIQLGVDQLPERVLDAVLHEVPTTPQRRSHWSAWRSLQMPTIAKVAAAAAVLLVIAVVGFRLVPASGEVGGPAPTASPTPAPTATPVPTITGTLAGQSALQPGRYRVNAGIPGVTVAVPAGWSAGADWVLRGPRGYEAPNGMAVRFYTIDNLAKNPLSAADGKIDPPLGPTVSNLVQAIVTHPGWTASPPADVTIGGRPGQRVEFAIPLDARLGADGQFCISIDVDGTCGIWGWAPGQTFDWYIVDVGGQRLVIDAFHYPGTSAADLAAQQAVVNSVVIGR